MTENRVSLVREECGRVVGRVNCPEEMAARYEERGYRRERTTAPERKPATTTVSKKRTKKRTTP